VIRREEPEPVAEDIGPYTPITEASGVVELPRLPRAIVRTNEAGTRSTKWVMTATWLMLAILALICAIGPHIPSGE